jgi:hypothetical protein
LTPLMTVEPRISQITHLPTWAFSQSMALESLSRRRMLFVSVIGAEQNP